MKFYYPDKDNATVTIVLPDSEGIVEVRERRLQEVGETLDGTIRGVDRGILIKLYRVRLLLTPVEWSALRNFIMGVVKLKLEEFDWEYDDLRRVRFGDELLRKQILAPNVVKVEFTLRERIDEGTS